jgi:hypothetical protein
MVHIKNFLYSSTGIENKIELDLAIAHSPCHQLMLILYLPSRFLLLSVLPPAESVKKFNVSLGPQINKHEEQQSRTMHLHRMGQKKRNVVSLHLRGSAGSE